LRGGEAGGRKRLKRGSLRRKGGKRKADLFFGVTAGGEDAPTLFLERKGSREGRKKGKRWKKREAFSRGDGSLVPDGKRE